MIHDGRKPGGGHVDDGLEGTALEAETSGATDQPEMIGSKLKRGDGHGKD